ncbi:hypothetical protein [Micavibrio aeruginosavorus]|uniref:hypothetical protein n=1 Tax=Micavibrio aeruginosavorus TaxID=349221 RepID=UPI003F4AA3C7
MTHNLKPAFDLVDIQNRISELKRQMHPLLSSPVRNDRIMLNHETGGFYLRSDVEKNGMDNASALGRIDLKTEYGVFKTAAKQVQSQKIERALSLIPR